MSFIVRNVDAEFENFPDGSTLGFFVVVVVVVFVAFPCSFGVIEELSWVTDVLSGLAEGISVVDGVSKRVSAVDDGVSAGISAADRATEIVVGVSTV